MTTIFCITSETESKMFMTLEGMAKWLNAKKPIDGQFSTIITEKAFYDITADNLAKVMEDSMEQVGLCADIRIRQDFFIQTIETRYVLSTVEVND